MIGVSLNDKALLARHLAVMIRSGLTVTESLAIAARAHRRLRATLTAVAASVASGRRLSEAMADHPQLFPALLITAVKTGETSGTLADNLSGVASELEKERSLVAKLRGAMIYPLTIFTLTIVLGTALSVLVFPKLLPLFSGLKINLPWTTRLLLRLSSLTESGGWWWLAGVLVVIGLILWWWRQPWMARWTHWCWLRLPVIRRLSREINLGRLFRRLGLLLRSGVSLDEALDLAGGASSNYYYRRATATARNQLIAGGKLSSSLAADRNLFPDLATRMVEVGESTGQLEETLFYLADFYESEVERAVKNLPTIIEPILLFGIGLIVALFALAIITPIYELTSLPQR